MHDQWYFSQNAKVFGPVASAQLKSLIGAGRVQPNDLVVRAGEKQWISVAAVPGLVPAAKPTPCVAATPPAATKFRKKNLPFALGIVAALLLCGAVGGILGFLAQGSSPCPSPREEAPVVQMVTKPALSVPVVEEKNPAEKTSEDVPAVRELQAATMRLAEAKAEIAGLQDQLAKLSKPRPMSKVLPPQAKKARSDRYEQIDRHALQTPPEAEKTLAGLAKYLTAPAANEEEKARAIFRWITDRIAYDAEALYRGPPFVEQDAENVLRKRLCVCAGYSDLFEVLCRHADLEAVTVLGYTGPPEKDVWNQNQSHAWNAVQVNGAWRLIEATWAAGYLKDKKYVKRYDDSYFMISPELLILDHFPNDDRLQFLPTPVSVETFRLLASTNVGQVRSLVALGLVQQDGLLEKLKNKASANWPKVWSERGHAVVVHAAPLRKELKAGTKLRVKVDVPNHGKAAIFNEGQERVLVNFEGFCEGELTLRPGLARVGVQLPGRGSDYWYMLEYVVTP